MASSSDWIDMARASVTSAGRPSPAWLASAKPLPAFVEGIPFVASPCEPATQTSQPQPDTPLDVPPGEADTGSAHGAADDELAQAHARGVAEGRAAGEAQLATMSDQVRALRLAFQTLDAAATEALAEELRDTVETLCSAAIDGFVADAPALLTRCEEAAKRLGAAADGCVLHLHPEDAEMVAGQPLAHWTVHMDASLERGAVRFEGPDGSVADGPGEWRRAIAAALRG